MELENGECCIRQEEPPTQNGPISTTNWRIPLLVTDGDADSTETPSSSKRLILLEAAEVERFKLAAGQVCLVNGGQAAFCRVVYDWSLLQTIGQNLNKLGTGTYLIILYC